MALLLIFLGCIAVYWVITMLQVHSVDKEIQQKKDAKQEEQDIRDKYGLHTRRSKWNM